MRRTATLLVTTIVILIIGGCTPRQWIGMMAGATTASTVEPEPTATPVPTATPTPTATPQPSPTPTPAPTATPTPPPLAARFTPRPDDRVRFLRTGIVHLQRVTSDPLRINLLLLDLTNPRVAIGVGIPEGRRFGLYRTSMLARESGALAAVNGDLFSVDIGTPQGLTMIDGDVLIAPKYRATFAWSRAHGPFIGYFTRSWTWQAKVRTSDGAYTSLTLLNVPCPPQQICMYNHYAQTVPGRSGAVNVLIDSDGRVRQITHGQPMRIGPGERALQGAGEGARWLLEHVTIGMPLYITTTTNPPLSRYTHAISGGPLILKDGRFVQDCLCALRDCSQTREPQLEQQCEDFSTDWKLKHYFDVRMPRTALALDRERRTLIVAVVDGYQPGYSRGVTQRELADLLLEFGADTAMELDGGGSSTMVIEGEVVNRPPDTTGERYVANALLFFWLDS